MPFRHPAMPNSADPKRLASLSHLSSDGTRSRRARAAREAEEHVEADPVVEPGAGKGKENITQLVSGSIPMPIPITDWLDLSK